MKKNLKKIISVVLAVIMVMSLIPTMASAASTLGEIEGLEVRKKVVLSSGDSYNIPKPSQAKYVDAIWYGDNDYSVKTIYNDDYSVATKLLALDPGVALILVDCWNDSGWGDSYWIIVVVKPNGETVNDMGKVTNAYDTAWEFKYKEEDLIYANINTYNDDYTYYCEYVVPYTYEAAEISEGGWTYAYAPGTDYATSYIIDAQGNIFVSELTVTVKYSFIQWIINYLLFGWLWGF